MKEVYEMAEMIARAYVKVYGIEKWNSLNEQQQHDVIMTIANDVNSRL